MSDFETVLNTPWDAKKKRIALRTGINMAYVEGGNPDGEVVILMHGFTCSSRGNKVLAEALGEKYHTYCLDFRGHGDTDKPKQFAYSLTQHVEDVTAFVDQMGIESFYATGHSTGSAAALGLAFTLGDRVKGLCLTSPFVRFHHGEKELREFDEMFERYEKNPPSKEEWFPSFMRYPDQEFPEYTTALIQKWPPYCWKTGWYGLEIVDFTKFLYKITAPTMLIWGGLDDLITEEHRVELAELMPNAKCKTYPDNTHEVNQENPSAIAEDTLSFFASIQA